MEIQLLESKITKYYVFQSPGELINKCHKEMKPLQLCYFCVYLLYTQEQQAFA